MRRLIILGTGTGVGKTHVTRALALALARADPQAAVSVLKPIETGLDVAAGATDAAALAACSQLVHPPTPHPLYGFAAPVTPWLAASREGQPVDLERVRRWADAAWASALVEPVPALHRRSSSQSPSSQPALSSDAGSSDAGSSDAGSSDAGSSDAEGWQLIESAGGVFSPLSLTTCNFDLAQRLAPAEWVLVAPDNLGALHEVRATWEALAARGRVPDHLVLSGARSPDASTGTNAALLGALGIPVSEVLPHQTSDLSSLAGRLVTMRRSTP